MATDVERITSNAWRTPTSIGLAVAIGAPLGVFLYATAFPFGPVLLGWFVALVGAIIVPGGLCFLATRGYLFVRLSFAAGVAGGTVGAAVLAPHGEPDFWWMIGGLPRALTRNRAFGAAIIRPRKRPPHPPRERRSRPGPGVGRPLSRRPRPPAPVPRGTGAGVKGSSLKGPKDRVTGRNGRHGRTCCPTYSRGSGQRRC